MKRTGIIIYLMLVVITINAQQRKTYSGVYELKLPFLQNANSTYNYYVEAGKKIKDGNFKLTFIGNSVYKGLNQTITGKYLRGKKNGLWTHTVTLKDWKNPSVNNSYATGTIKLVVNYVNGLPNGASSFNSTLKGRKKDYLGRFSSFSPSSTLSFKASFKHGIAINKFYFRDHQGERNTENIIEAEMTSEGLLKMWKQTYNGEIEAKFYDNGIPKDNNYSDTKIKIDKYNTLRRTNPEALKDLGYSIDSISMGIDGLLLNGFSELLLFKDLSGDDFYSIVNRKPQLNCKSSLFLRIGRAVSGNINEIAKKSTLLYNQLKARIKRNRDEIKYNSPKALQEIRKEYNKLEYDNNHLNIVLKDAIPYYSGESNFIGTIKPYQDKKGISASRIFNSIYEDLKAIEKRCVELENKALTIPYNNYLVEAKQARSKEDFNTSLDKLDLALKYASNYPKLKLNILEIKQLKKEIKNEQVLVEVRNKIIGIEVGLKVPPSNLNVLSSSDLSRLKNIYGNRLREYNQALTLENMNINFPDRPIKLETVYFGNNTHQAQAKLWAKDIEYIHQVFSLLVENYRNEIKGAKGTMNSVIAKELNEYIDKLYSAINGGNRKDYNKQFKKANDIEAIKSILDRL